MADSEYHVASFIVGVRPENALRLSESINAMDGLEVHVTADSKLVVTAEASSARELAELAEQVRTHSDAITVSPVYHEYTTQEESGSEPGTQINLSAGASEL